MTQSKIIEQFFKALKRGSGEAYWLAKNNPDIDFSEQIIQGVLICFSYDQQSEGNRAKYIFDIISTTNQTAKIRQAILFGLATEQEEFWNLMHLFALAKLFAERGDVEIKQAIYHRFLHNPIEGGSWAGYAEILELDGLQGLMYIAEKFGKFIENNLNSTQDKEIIAYAQEQNPSINVNQILENAAKENKHIRTYLNNIKQTQAHKHIYSPKKQTKNIVDKIINSEPVTVLGAPRHLMLVEIRKQLSATQVNEIAERLLIETNPSNIEKLLVIFGTHKFPFNSQLILSFAQQKGSQNTYIVEHAVKALKHLKSNAIRAFALDRINHSDTPVKYLEILVSNYQSGDFKTLTKFAKQTNDEQQIEDLAIIFSEIFTANSTKECKQPLEILYAKMNCGIHRKEIIEILIKNQVLSAKIKDEIEFDSYLPTRALINKRF